MRQAQKGEGGGEKRKREKGIQSPFFSSPKWEQKTKRIPVQFWLLNRETNLPLTSGDIQMRVCTSYTIMIAISQQTKGKERWLSFIAVQLVRSYTEFSRETVVRLALGEFILWHSYPFHNPLRSFRNSGCIYTLPLQLWAFLGGWVSLFCMYCALVSSSCCYLTQNMFCNIESTLWGQRIGALWIRSNSCCKCTNVW